MKGTRIFLSINAHNNGIPNTNDDLESLIYSLLYLSDKGLPWIHLNCKNKDKYKETLKMKINFEYYKFCGLEYKFLADSLEFLRYYCYKHEDIKYSVFKALFKNASDNKIINIKKENKFCFIKEIKEAILDLNNKKKHAKADERLNKLFQGYVINFKGLYKDLSK